MADGTDSTITLVINHGGGSRITNQDERSENQQPLASNTPTLTAVQDRGDPSEGDRLWLLGSTLIPVPVVPRGRGQIDGDPVQAQSDQLGPNTPDLHPVQSKHKDQRPRVQRPSDVAPEHTPGSGQDDGNTDEPAQSKRSKGKSWCSGYISLSSALNVTT